jgi:hypothetical protein
MIFGNFDEVVRRRGETGNKFYANSVRAIDSEQKPHCRFPLTEELCGVVTCTTNPRPSWWEATQNDGVVSDNRRCPSYILHEKLTLILIIICWLHKQGEDLR